MAKQFRDQKYLEKVGKRIVTLREGLGISQEKLSELSGLDTRQIGRIERAENNSSISLVKKIADSLKVKVSELIDV
ncbi:helix-turn-helix domain-containing protein [Emticicia sp. 21SJ11W-3]|uniref:helix-turn-helix domain-containing protein n=1 Tax=Emticicia sp. 21SJ11W-3 TaxID=2916755 RepID=UPI00209E9BF8|nr:helix-turn-helix transcriptional regulator [Emticicia sp. 21SJ11W-3]UTA67550.1 helix-turn-helix domain-containing protein [Emticicia sp. 21SJ11W-3]